MSRPLRIEYPDAWYHVMNRGRRGEETFSTPEDFETFIKLLKEGAEQWNVRISAYSLLSNHYHLLIQTPLGNLSRFMRHLNGVYTQRYNRIHECDGQLFRGRYKAILVEEDSYLLELVRYIHRNPLKAGLVEKIGQYAWSSHFDYLTDEKQSTWLHKDFVLAMLATDVEKRLKAYQQFIAQEDSEEIAGIFDNKKLPGILGTEAFIDQIKNRFFADKNHQQVPDSGQLAPSADRIIAAVCQHYGIEQSRLMHSVRGVSNEPRNVAIYLVRILRRDGLLSIGTRFGMRGYSPAGSAIDRIRKKLTTSKDLQQQINTIKQQLTASECQTET
ncbi:MAG: transposase [Desulfuromonadales bacterium]|jgi:REP element-mobilizing transposase RayT|nr:transposase [Desulfuromonadales bacterium]